MLSKELKLKAKRLRKTIVKMEFHAKRGHFSSCLSLVEILIILYWDILNINPKDPKNPKRDRLILSKGHAAKALYAILSQRGFFLHANLKSYGADGSSLGVHPDHLFVAGVELTTGSLGHGLSVGAGIALAAKLNSLTYRTFVILSDGECDEGAVWESALFTGHRKLDNLVAIIDYNKWQAFGRIKDVADLEPFADKWRAFGWGVKEVDGHSFSQLKKALKKTPFVKGKPSVIIAHTIAGKGISFAEDTLDWHYLNMDKAHYKQALKELR